MMMAGILAAALLFAPAGLAALERADQYAELRSRLLRIKGGLERAGKLRSPEDSLTIGLIHRQRLLGAAVAMDEAADLYLELKEPAKAAALYRKALDEKPSAWRKAKILHGLACAAIEENDEDMRSYRQALARFEEASGLGHKSSGLRALSHHGACFSGWHVWVYGGRDEEVFTRALSACGEALRQGPPSEIASDVYVTLGSMYGDHRDRKLSILNYEQALRVNPRNAVAKKLLKK